jgi:hypothetical protein
MRAAAVAAILLEAEEALPEVLAAAAREGVTLSVIRQERTGSVVAVVAQARPRERQAAETAVQAWSSCATDCEGEHVRSEG